MGWDLYTNVLCMLKYSVYQLAHINEEFFMIDLAITVPMLHAKHNTTHQNQNAISDQRVLCGPSLAILEEMWISHPWRTSADIGIQPVPSLNSSLLWTHTLHPDHFFL